jgi:hypothetical protein
MVSPGGLRQHGLKPTREIRPEHEGHHSFILHVKPGMVVVFGNGRAFEGAVNGILISFRRVWWVQKYKYVGEPPGM